MAISAISRLFLAAGLTLSLWAQLPSTPAVPAPAAPTDALGRTTPRGTVMGFLRAVSAEDYKRAARYMQTQAAPARAENLAMELGTVLNRRLQIDIERVSALPEGTANDDIQQTRDLLGIIHSPHGPVEVTLDRVAQDDKTKIWLFSAETLKEIPHLYEGTDSFWLEANLPDQLKDTQLLGRPVWRWLMWLLGLVIALGGSAALQFLLRWAWRIILRRLDPDEPQSVGLALGGPLRVFLFALIVMFLSSFAATILSRQFWFRAGATIAVFSGGWLLSRLVDSAAAIAGYRLQKRTGAQHDSTIWLMQRAGKFVVGLIGILILLKLAQIELTGILTGLGIGGLAFAFAAQKTIENLFGGVMITTDRSIRVGDTCRVGDVTGTIVDIGIRSTRIRTLNRTIVSIPNGQTAAVSIENFTRRDKFHCLHVIGVRYETDAAAMRGVLDALRELLEGFSEVERGTVRVRFIRFGASSLDIEVRTYLYAASYDEFLERQERVLLAVMDTLAGRGVGIAFPSQTLYLTKDV
ncbi:MAG TPA: mechanosensitive ion channel domain-containing protein [Paludibaculum sp.]|jgi:MscS family membrane protein